MKRVFDVMSLFVIAFTTLMSFAVLSDLPARIATHFDASGTPNGWSSREVGAFLLPALALFLWLCVRVGTTVAARLNGKDVPGAIPFVAFATTLLLCGIHFAMLRFALVPGARMMGITWGVLGIFLFVLGQALPRVQRNSFVGVRTAWSLSSPEAWARTQRFASYVFSIGGVLVLLAALLDSGALAISVLLVTSIMPVIYSYVAAKSVAK